MENRKTQISVVALLSVLLFGMAFYSWVKPADDFSFSERRNLKQRPALTVESLFAGGNNSFMSKFEDYATDQFPFREGYRSIYSATSLYVLGKKEINSIYLYDDHAIKVEYPLNEESVDWTVTRIKDLKDRYLADNAIYVCVIPDKNYFMAKRSGHPALDYDKLFSGIQEGTKDIAAYLDITGLLTIDDYYYTDTHWKQENIKPIADMLCKQMGGASYESYDTVTLDTPFYGVYYGQAALPLKPDKLTCMTNDTMRQLKAYCLDTGKAESIPLYDLEKATGKDGYEVYLTGSKSLITVENPKAESDRELIIFRDSFGSSLAPLMTCGYKKVTLVDTRYISPQYLGNYVEFGDADVLFLYSVSLINDGKNQLMR